MNRDIFVKSINDRLVVRVTYVTNNKRVLTRKCIPFDIGPSTKFKDKSIRYHFLDLNGPKGAHNLPLLPGRVLNIELTDLYFEPSKYIKWKPNWFLKRNWGKYS
ncbi:hypothetical protein [Tenacibaculum aestuariivivum]|uniref:hypothetical protein n=1 Tax=Tenacibaculum aestuariivivum TaxID=2006131 RepID=UPI003AB58A66